MSPCLAQGALSAAVASQAPPADTVWTTWHDTCPVVSPDGQQVLFLSTRANPDTADRSSKAGRHGLCLVPVTGDAEPKVLATGSVVTPSWSPDGTKVAYCRKPDADAESRLEVLEIESGAITVVEAPARTVFGQPVWLPDGRIAALARPIDRPPLFGNGFAFDPVIVDPKGERDNVLRLAAPEATPEELQHPMAVGGAHSGPCLSTEPVGYLRCTTSLPPGRPECAARRRPRRVRSGSTIGSKPIAGLRALSTS